MRKQSLKLCPTVNPAPETSPLTPLSFCYTTHPSFKGTFSFSKSQLRPHKNCDIHPFPCFSFRNVQIMLGVTEPLISCCVPLLSPKFGKREMEHAQ